MRILGLSFGFHDAGACMLQDTTIEFAGHSERYSKEKNDALVNPFKYYSRYKGVHYHKTIK
mgnify:CR=1 FL=1